MVNKLDLWWQIQLMGCVSNHCKVMWRKLLMLCQDMEKKSLRDDFDLPWIEGHRKGKFHSPFSSWTQWPLALLTHMVPLVESHLCLLPLMCCCSVLRPQYGGRFCPGLSRLYKLCNTDPCHKNSLDFRAQQCAEYNTKPFRGWFYQWKPYTKVEGKGNGCELHKHICVGWNVFE